MAKETPLVILCLKFCLIGLCLGNEPVDVESIYKKVLELEIELLKLKNEVCGRDHEVQELSQLTRTPNVAFRSVLSTTTGPMVKGQIIVFDQVGLNIGNGYNRYTGIFTVPYNGTYIFSMSLGNPGGNNGAFSMMHLDGNKQTVLEYVFAGQTSGWNMGGVTTVADVSAGDSVWVAGEGFAAGVSPPDRYHTGFSGILVNTQ